MDIDDKIEKLLDSLEGTKRAQAPENLFAQTLERIQSTGKIMNGAQLIPMRIVWRVAAVFFGIALLNFYVVKTYLQKSTSEKNEITSAESLKEIYFTDTTLNL